MTWEDDTFDIEYASFQKATNDDVALLSPNQTVGYFRIHWDSVQDYVNTWNKKRKRVMVNKIDRYPEGLRRNDDINEYDLWLDMGARLFKELKKHAPNKPKYLRIIKDSNPLDKFDTWYHAYVYKLVKFKTVTPKK
jgi:hypothetical protein